MYFWVINKLNRTRRLSQTYIINMLFKNIFLLHFFLNTVKLQNNEFIIDLLFFDMCCTYFQIIYRLRKILSNLEQQTRSFPHLVSRSMSHLPEPGSSRNDVTNVCPNDHDVIAGLSRTKYPTPGSGSETLSENMCQVSNYVETFHFFRFFQILEVLLYTNEDCFS